MSAPLTSAAFPYVSTLRVYEPLHVFSDETQQAILAQGALDREEIERQEARAAAIRNLRDGEADPFPHSVGELFRSVQVRGEDGPRTYYNPSQMGLRTSRAANVLMSNIPGPLPRILIPQGSEMAHQIRTSEAVQADRERGAGEKGGADADTDATETSAKESERGAPLDDRPGDGDAGAPKSNASAEENDDWAEKLGWGTHPENEALHRGWPRREPIQFDPPRIVFRGQEDEAGEAPETGAAARGEEPHLYTLTATFGPPIPWFVAFSPGDAYEVVESSQRVETIRIRTSVTLANERIKHALASIALAAPEMDILDALTPLAEWLGRFSPDAVLEMDYGLVADLVFPDETPYDVAMSVECVAEGDMLGAAAAYHRLEKRWSAVKQLARAS